MPLSPIPFIGPLAVAYDVVDYVTSIQYVISGITRDSAGTSLGSCNVEIFETVSGILRGATISDANGNYSIEVTNNGLDPVGNPLTFFVVAYKAGSPDVSGTTINTLVGAQQ